MTKMFSEPDTWDVFVADNMHHLNEAADLARCKSCENEWENDWQTPPQFCPYCGREVTNWEEWL